MTTFITASDIAIANMLVAEYKDYHCVDGMDYMYLVDVDGVWVASLDEDKLALVTSDTWMK